jgi:hypothetical protein
VEVALVLAQWAKQSVVKRLLAHMFHIGAPTVTKCVRHCQNYWRSKCWLVVIPGIKVEGNR